MFLVLTSRFECFFHINRDQLVGCTSRSLANVDLLNELSLDMTGLVSCHTCG